MSSLNELSTKERIHLHYLLLVSSGFRRSKLPEFALLHEKLNEEKPPIVKYFLEAAKELEGLSTQAEEKLAAVQLRREKSSLSEEEDLNNAERLYRQDLSSFQALIPLVMELCKKSYPQLFDAE